MKTNDDLDGARDAVQALPGALPVEGSGEPIVPSPTEAPARSQWRLFLRRFLHHKVALASLVVLVLLYVIVALAPHLAFYKLNPNPLPLQDANHGPSAAHWFGTDEFGRDVLSRAMVGARISTLIALGVVVAAVSGILHGRKQLAG